MKKFNGTDYDGLLPLAYNALNSENSILLGGESLSEVKKWVEDGNVTMGTYGYKGSGLYGQDNPNTFVFPFEPIIWFPPTTATDFHYATPFITSCLTTDFVEYNLGRSSCYVKMSADRKTITLYSSSGSSQNNTLNTQYYTGGIGGYDKGATQIEWFFTSSTTFIVPVTGQYYIELYGNGGAACYFSFGSPYANQPSKAAWTTGGASCQSYTVTLTKGEEIPVSCQGVVYSHTGLSPKGASFGSYSVAAGGTAENSATDYANFTISSINIAKGAGNKGANGSSSGVSIIYGSETPPSEQRGHVFGTGKYSSGYGYGQGCGDSQYMPNKMYSPRAVYVKYIGT